MRIHIRMYLHMHMHIHMHMHMHMHMRMHMQMYLYMDCICILHIAHYMIAYYVLHITFYLHNTHWGGLPGVCICIIIIIVCIIIDRKRVGLRHIYNRNYVLAHPTMLDIGIWHAPHKFALLI